MNLFFKHYIMAHYIPNFVTKNVAVVCRIGSKLQVRTYLVHVRFAVCRTYGYSLVCVGLLVVGRLVVGLIAVGLCLMYMCCLCHCRSGKSRHKFPEQLYPKENGW
jgi:hypothetical protein